MECPKCGSELEELIKRVILPHPFGKKKNTLKQKTGKKYVHKCTQCKKFFIISKCLVEAELAW